MTKMRDITYEKGIKSHISQCVSFLNEIATEKEFTIKDYYAIERVLQKLIESYIGIARYVLKIKHHSAVSQSSEALNLLFKLGHLNEAELNKFKAMIGYRNILVHDYLTTNPAITKNIIVEKKYLDLASGQEKLLNLLEK